VTLSEEPRVTAEGQTLTKTRPLIRQATALWFHLDPTSFDLVEDVQLPEPIKSLVSHARAERKKAHAAQQAAVASSRQAAGILVRELNMTLRDAADLLGLSHSRIQQLLGE
jgi:hypothetical protein